VPAAGGQEDPRARRRLTGVCVHDTVRRWCLDLESSK
jgi:hypothetical protein